MASDSLIEDQAEWLLLSEAAAEVRGSVSTLRRRIAAGELPASRVGGKLLIARKDLEAFMRANRVLPHAA